MVQSLLKTYQSEVNQELENILNFWINHSFDNKNGGFIGKMDINGQVDFDAPKGLVLNARILWTFAAAYKKTQNQVHLATTQRALDALKPFKDEQFGGYYWSINANNTPLPEGIGISSLNSMRKQIYGLAFVLYGLSEFYAISGEKNVLTNCLDIFNWIEKNSFNPKNKGYLEAVDRDGSPLEDMRLSPKDKNDPLSMNTHLHILEAYSNLYKVWHDERLKKQIENLIDIFLEDIIDTQTKHLILFFNENWQSTDTTISYGHDIEAAWLVLEAAETIDYKVLECQKMAVDIADAVLKGLDTEGGLDYESDRKERHWWVQAEALVGFLNAFELSKEAHFLEKSMLCWDFTKKYMIDYERGEWFWGYTEGGELMRNEDKIGFWKCPYHNARACMEVSSRLEKLK